MAKKALISEKATVANEVDEAAVSDLKAAKGMVLPCLRGVLGNWVYYSSMMTAKQIAESVLAVKDIRESETLDDLLQRDLKERKKQIADYLLDVKAHFFNSIILGLFNGVPNWLEFDLSKASGYVASNEDLKSIKESMGILIFNGGEQMFAIDGQHRVAGIQIAYEKDTEKPLRSQELKDDQFSVILIAHKDDKLGKKRTRKLFSDINKNAKPVAGGDRIKIDEQDLDAIVARRVYSEYPNFQKGKLIDLTEHANLTPNDYEHFTNLLGLYSTNKILNKGLFTPKLKVEQWDEKNVEAFQKIVVSFYDYVLLNVPDYNSFFNTKSLSLEEARKENKNIAFRPIGLFLIAKLYVYFFSDLAVLTKLLSKLSFTMPGSPFNGILWSKNRMLPKSKNQSVAYNLALYLAGKLSKQEATSLLENYREVLDKADIELPSKLL
jgi:DNA sulfur modification protein DndB